MQAEDGVGERKELIDLPEADTPVDSTDVLLSVPEKIPNAFKIALLGASGAGKTCLMHRVAEGIYKYPIGPTLGVDYISKKVQVGDRDVRLHVWDTAGAERFQKIVEHYYQGSHGIIVVYDVTDRTSFERARCWLSTLRSSYSCDEIDIVLVGNKIDLATGSARNVSEEEGRACAREFAVAYWDVSAKSNKNIGEVFNHLAERIVTRLDPATPARAARAAPAAPKAQDLSDEAVYCGMCLEQQPSSVLSCCQGHAWCKPCLAGYIGSEIACNQLAVRCPWIADDAMARRCTELVDEATVLAVIDEESAGKYRRFKALNDPLMRECPLKQADGTPCLHWQKGSVRSPAMVCKQCNGTYCFVHANAHPGETCRAYTKRQKTITKANDWFIKQISKRCPGCKAPTQKGPACNHMTCTQCHTHWCWVCGTRVSSGESDHFSPFNPFGCGPATIIGDFITTSYARNVLHFMALAAARLAIAPFYLFAWVASTPTLLLLSIICLPSICYKPFNGQSFYGMFREVLCGSSASSRNRNPLPLSIVLFMAAYWPLVFFGLANMLALSPLLCVCCCWQRGFYHYWFHDRPGDRFFQLLAVFSLWPCFLSLLVLFLAAFATLLPLNLVYALIRAPHSGAQLDLPI